MPTNANEPTASTLADPPIVGTIAGRIFAREAEGPDLWILRADRAEVLADLAIETGDPGRVEAGWWYLREIGVDAETGDPLAKLDRATEMIRNDPAVHVAREWVMGTRSPLAEMLFG